MFFGLRAEWNPLACLLMEAWQLYQSSLCSGCGVPSAFAHDPDYANSFAAEKFTCHACAQLAQASQFGGKPGPGEHLTIVSDLDGDFIDEIDAMGHHLAPGDFDPDEIDAPEPNPTDD